MAAIHEGLKPHIKHLLREVTDEDVTRLTEIRIKRISKFDSFKADERIAALEGDIDKVKHHLDHLTEYAIDWFKKLKDKYGKGRERKTELRTFESIDRSKVAVANAKLYWNPERRGLWARASSAAKESCSATVPTSTTSSCSAGTG